ncbi:MAG: 50S ribosomal protein L18 [Bacteroidia bacterium]
MLSKKTQRRNKIRSRIRGRVFGTKEKPRLSVFRSNKEIYAQLIDDVSGITLAAFSSKNIKDEKVKKIEKAALVGKELAGKAIEAGILKVVFDRSGYLYHGRVKSLADGAREGGLKF